VAKKLKELKKFVESNSTSFNNHLYSRLSDDVVSFLKELNTKTKAYVFSGIIRNYFLNEETIRDLDLIIEYNENIPIYLESFSFKKNSFGGYKLNFASIQVDLWYINKTWAISDYQKIVNFYIPEYITSTSFFNFSSILFDLQSQQFIINNEFLKFLRDKRIELVFEPNPNVQLCIINSFYYEEKYNLRLGKKLQKYLVRKFKNIDQNFNMVQIKHFGKILYLDNEIKEKINRIESDLLKKSKNSGEKKRKSKKRRGANLTLKL